MMLICLRQRRWRLWMKERRLKCALMRLCVGWAPGHVGRMYWRPILSVREHINLPGFCAGLNDWDS